MDTAAIEDALNTLRPALDADGFDLNFGAMTPAGDVEVILQARPGACLDCLVPERVMVEILEDALRRHGTSPRRVTVVRVGF